MRHYVIDFQFLSDYDTFWDLIIEALEFPDWFGRNISAFWDLVTGWIEQPCKIALLNCTMVPETRRWTFDKMVELIKRAHDMHFEVDYEIRN